MYEAVRKKAVAAFNGAIQDVLDHMSGNLKELVLLLLYMLTAFGHAASIHDAASRGDVAEIQKLLASTPAMLNATNAAGDTALHLAAEFGHFAVAELLVASNATVNVTDREGSTPLHMAACTRRVGAVSNIQSGLMEIVVRMSNMIAVPLSPQVLQLPTNALAAVRKAIFSGTEDRPEVVSAKRRIVEMLLAHGASVTNANGPYTPLNLAAFNPDGDILRLLLKHGADPKPRDNMFGGQPIHLAVLAGNCDGVAALIEAGADVNAGVTTGVTPLLWACDAEDEPMVQLLLKAGADVELAANSGKRPLHAALEAGSGSIVALLLEHGANVKATGYAIKLTPLHLAASNGSEKLLAQLLDKGAEVDAMDNEGFTPLLNAIERGHRQAADLLVAHGANPLATTRDRRNALHIATSDNRLELMQWAMDRGCDVNSRDKTGATPLYQAAFQGHPAAATFLISKDANPNAKNNHLDTLLHAVAYGTFMNKRWSEDAKTNAAPKLLPPFGSPADYVATAALLLTNGARVDAENAELFTPLHLAAIGSVEVVKFLLEHGADVNAQNVNGFTPLLGAAQFGTAEIAEVLIAHGAQLDAVQTRGESQGFNAMHWAAHTGNTPVLKVLLQHKCDVRYRGRLGDTALHWAAINGREEAAAVLVEAGADVNAKDSYGQTPLHTAVAKRNVEMVEWLLAHRADASLTDGKGATPLDVARRENYFEIIQLLRPPVPKSK